MKSGIYTPPSLQGIELNIKLQELTMESIKMYTDLLRLRIEAIAQGDSAWPDGIWAEIQSTALREIVRELALHRYLREGLLNEQMNASPDH